MANPNPDMSGLKPFEKGCSGNPAGKTSAQRKAEVEAAELAAFVSRDLVKAVHDLVHSADNDEAKLEHLRSDTLALLRDVQNRAHGTPKSSVDMSSQDGSMSPVGVGASDIADAIRRKHAKEPQQDSE